MYKLIWNLNHSDGAFALQAFSFVLVNRSHNSELMFQAQLCLRHPLSLGILCMKSLIYFLSFNWHCNNNLIFFIMQNTNWLS